MNFDRVEARFQLLMSAVLETGAWMSGDQRIGEDTTASLIGWSKDSLRNARTEGRAPPHYRIGGGGARITYALLDVAEWIESQRENNFT